MERRINRKIELKIVKLESIIEKFTVKNRWKRSLNWKIN
jgi:hypothetical protein